MSSEKKGEKALAKDSGAGVEDEGGYKNTHRQSLWERQGDKPGQKEPAATAAPVVVIGRTKGWKDRKAETQQGAGG